MNKVQFDYKDFALASYLIVKGNKFTGIETRFVKRFNEFKVFVKIEGNKEDLLSLQEQYEDNKLKILKDNEIKKKINELRLAVGF
jgi:hypothetical protein